MEEFEAQSPKYATPRSLVQAHYGGATLHSQGMIILRNTSSPSCFDAISAVKIEGNPDYAIYVFIIVIVFPPAYAGVHMSGWNGAFPTTYESQIWTACSLFMASAPFATLFCVGMVVGCFKLHHSHREQRRLTRAVVSTSRILVRLMVLCYWFARIFLVVESFISLRVVPIGVYWTPLWLQMIPHV